MWPRRRRPRLVLGIVVTTVLLFLLAAILLIFGDSAPGSGYRKAAEILFQAAVFAVLGGLLAGYVKYVFDRDAEDRASRLARRDEEREGRRKVERDRRDFLRRLAHVHGTIENASILVRSHNSVDVYLEQFRRIIGLTSELWEVHEDLLAADPLFEKDHAAICGNVKSIIDYVEAGVGDYEVIVGMAGGRGSDCGSLRSALSESSVDLRWVGKFLSPGETDSLTGKERRLPGEYEVALDNSKGKMREYVFGSKSRSSPSDGSS